VYTGHLPKNTTFHVGDDASSTLWIPKNKIPFEKVAFDGLKKALRDYLKK
jgi:hypothetical protein